MASTFTIDTQPDGHGSIGAMYAHVGTFNLGVYATGGVAVAPAQLSFGDHIFHLSCEPTGGYVFEFLKATGLVKAYQNVNPAAVGGADVPLNEVTNATNLAAIVGRFFALGR